jgi:glycosyltransferase involved in cell wall biosynthesis
MFFSVVIPTYNRRALLERCLKALTDLDFPKNEYEIIVVDDGSADGTKEYLVGLKDPNIRVYLRDHGGPAKARNYGVRNAIGSNVAFTDDDCFVPGDWLSRLKEGLEKWPKAAAVGGYLEAPAEILSEKVVARLESLETREVYKAGKEDYLGGFESPAGGTNNIVYRKAVFNKLNGFDENFPEPAGEDADLKYRAVQMGFKFGYIPLKVTHLDPYSFKTFLKRSLRSGIGSAYFEKKHFNKTDTFVGLSTILLKALVNLIFSVICVNKLAAARYLKEIFMIYGRAKLTFNL